MQIVTDLKDSAPGSAAPKLPNAFHGGKSFEAIGVAFDNLGRASQVINADVLDAWFDPSPRVLEKLRDFLPFLVRTSPPARSEGLISALSRIRAVPEACILPGGGSSDLIFTCFPHLIGAQGRALILDPMYGEYSHILEAVLGVDVRRFDLHKESGFRIDTDALITKAAALMPDLVAVVNPNSPTGQLWPRSELLRFVDSLPDSTKVVIDETYIEYVGGAESVENEARNRPNLLVLKSMSKVYALSGMRVGYLVGAASTIEALARWMPPWGVSLPAQVAAMEALNDPAYYERQYWTTRILRQQLTEDLSSVPGVRAYPSLANFVLIETQFSAQRLLERMQEAHVYVRNCDSMSIRFADRFLRIAVKTEDQNKRIVGALCRAGRNLA